MHITSLTLKDFRQYKDLNIDLVPGVNLLVGTNGAGKTTILEAAIVAFAPFFAGATTLRLTRSISKPDVRISNNLPREQTKITAGVVFERNEEIKVSRSYNLLTGSNDSKNVGEVKGYGLELLKALLNPHNQDIAPLIVYKSTARLFVEANQSKKQIYDVTNGRLNGYLNCTSGQSIGKVLDNWLGNAVIRRANQQIAGVVGHQDLVLDNVEAAIKICLKEMMGMKAEFKIWTDPDSNDQVIIDFGGGNGLPLNSYSDGFRNALILVIELVWRASQLNPWLDFGAMSQQSTGVVLIDEIDLHLHPTWQAKVVGLLVKFFPNVQFLLTTHSPTVVANFLIRSEHPQEADEDSLPIDALFLVNKESCNRLDNSVYGQDINTVLSTIMGANERPEVVLDKIKTFWQVAGSADSKIKHLTDLEHIVSELQSTLPATDLGLIKILGVWNRIQAAKAA